MVSLYIVSLKYAAIFLRLKEHSSIYIYYQKKSKESATYLYGYNMYVFMCRLYMFRSVWVDSYIYCLAGSLVIHRDPETMEGSGNLFSASLHPCRLPRPSIYTSRPFFSLRFHPLSIVAPFILYSIFFFIVRFLFFFFGF